MQCLPGAALIDGAEAADDVHRGGDGQRGIRHRRTAENRAARRPHDRHEAVAATVAEGFDLQGLGIEHDGAVVQGKEPAVGREFEQRVAQAAVVREIGQGIETTFDQVRPSSSLVQYWGWRQSLPASEW